MKRLLTSNYILAIWLGLLLIVLYLACPPPPPLPAMRSQSFFHPANFRFFWQAIDRVMENPKYLYHDEGGSVGVGVGVGVRVGASSDPPSMPVDMSLSTSSLRTRRQSLPLPMMKKAKEVMECPPMPRSTLASCTRRTRTTTRHRGSSNSTLHGER